MSTSVQRLELSRARLRHAMLPPPALPGDEHITGALAWLERIKQQPAIAILIDTLQGWWSRHPLRAAVHVASEAGNAVAKPIAQHNPIALVALACVAGAVLAWSRPWRWALKPALFAGLMPQLVSRVVANLPLESWLAVLTQTPTAAPPHTDPLRNSP
jgi:hypothetical protein